MKGRRWLCAVGALLGLGLTGCMGPHVDIPPDSSTLRPCAPSPAPLLVQDLPTATPAACDLVGATVQFPDGYDKVIPEIGTSSASGGGGMSDTHFLFNFGSLGIVASERAEKSTQTRWWGSEEGLRRYWNAFGRIGETLYG
ncbi:hypothetical protein KNO15_10195 [Leifsonia shinshuensis]|uniref:hypothetical protein n=1 Tax=Leifsonia shinshuensis TaxID=150026 RepID=UPI001F514430|nr:hypothetical protein [Leifsonia shinshuensis]MCI0157065.1 hypothetical protein [Leifsonia shinshuensis]